MALADFRKGAWSDERRERMGAIHRARHGAPEGMATLFGVHVPLEHRDALTLFAARVRARNGPVAASEFVAAEREKGWANMPEYQAGYELALEVRRNKLLIRELANMGHRHANQNSR